MRDTLIPTFNRNPGQCPGADAVLRRARLWYPAVSPSGERYNSKGAREEFADSLSRPRAEPVGNTSRTRSWLL
jgi:hypothetical protein